MEKENDNYIKNIEIRYKKRAILFFKYIEYIEKKLNLFNNFIENSLNKLKSIFYKISKISALFIIISKAIWENPIINALIRYTTYPFNYFWIKHYHSIHVKKGEHTFLDEPGVHMVVGSMGAGKSSSVFYNIMNDLNNTGKGSYINTQLEKAKKDFDNEEYVYNRLFKLEEFFKDGKQIRAFNTDSFDKIVLDELHYYLNQRQNKTKNYNNVFLPLLKQITNMRHDGIKKVILLSQQPYFDSQVMNVVTYYHKVKIKKGLLYYFWLFTGVNINKSYGIKGWKFETQVIQQGQINNDKRAFTKWFYKYDNKSYILDDFETLNMKDRKEKKEMKKDNVY